MKTMVSACFVMLTLNTSCTVLNSCSTSYWKQRAVAAEAVIQQVEEDIPDYVMDVLCEGDKWAEWEESK